MKIRNIGNISIRKLSYISYLHRGLCTIDTFCYLDIIAKKPYFINSFCEYNNINWDKIILLNDGIAFVDELYDEKAVFYITEKGKIDDYNFDYFGKLKSISLSGDFIRLINDNNRVYNFNIKSKRFI